MSDNELGDMVESLAPKDLLDRLVRFQIDTRGSL
jgi:hypothetical protein